MVTAVIGNFAFVERALLQRLLGATFILVGCAIMVIDVPHLDVVVWSVASTARVSTSLTSSVAQRWSQES